MRRNMRALILVLFIIILVGCGTLSLTSRYVPKPKLDDYIDLPFDKLVNRTFLDEVKNNYVRIDADFGYMFLSQDIDGYPAEEWIRINIIKDSMRYDNVMVPKSEAETYFNLLRGEPVTIYAKTTVWLLRSFAGIKNPDEIALNVTGIQRRRSKEVVRFPDITGWKLINGREQDGVEVKTYQNDGKSITVYYEEGKPTGYWKAPIPQGQNMTAYCDKDGDGIFETVLTNNPNCYYLGK